MPDCKKCDEIADLHSAHPILMSLLSKYTWFQCKRKWMSTFKIEFDLNFEHLSYNSLQSRAADDNAIQDNNMLPYATCSPHATC